MKTFLEKHAKKIFWLCMIIAQYIGALLFKDLADISQWFVQSDRETTMWVWYNRHGIAIIALLAFGVMIGLKYIQRNIIGNKTFITLGLIFAFSFFSGMMNPHLMMRDRMHNGHFVSVEAAKKYLRPHESVIVMEIHGKARAHSDKQLLRPHVAGKPVTEGQDNVVMTYCGLTNLGMAYIPEINGKPLDLAPANQLRNNLVMWDRHSGEPVQQLWGQHEADRNHGLPSKMKEWPTFRMPFERFAEAYPDGEVFVNDYLVADMRPTFWENPFLAVYDPIMESIFKLAISYQAYYDEPTFPTVEYKDMRLPSKEKVWGLNIGEDYVAYTERFVRMQPNPINVAIGEQNIVLHFDETYESLGIFYNHTGKDIQDINFFGETEFGKLARVETVKAGAYWIIWADFFPQTDVNRL
ncbi:DUF3179 domain-containing (seleno)protein [Photobacterium galatheae]|uniref:DUF3179 domain-containing protein n=2 Tax=Photobacterium galatheae TaxID=1654360 RepID=A0A066RQB2_9GAMM|nr:DUF3179 domain-containing (seleno)protein [Photobacterium galatheae]KDM91286.1 hypothetical protein EA58_11985 [Photobacterium galatheae]